MYEHTNDFIGGDPLADSFVFTVFDGDDGLIAENIFNILIEPPFLISEGGYNKPVFADIDDDGRSRIINWVLKKEHSNSTKTN